MKWFKHPTDLFRDEGIRAYLGSFQDQITAYGFLILILEIVSERMNSEEDDPKCAVTFPVRDWARLTNCHVNRVNKYLACLPETGWVSLKFDKGNCTVEIAKLLEWRDKDRRKPRKSRNKDAQNRTEEKRLEQRESNAALSESQQEEVPIDRSQRDFVLTPDRRAWAESKRPDIDIDFETEKFRVHVFPTPPVNIDAAWRKWIINARPTSSSRANETVVHDGRRQLLELGPLLGIQQGSGEAEDAYLARVREANDKRIANLNA